MAKKIAVIGSGSWGTAMAVHLAKMGHTIDLWSWKEEESNALEKHRENVEFLPGVKIPENVSFTFDISCVRDKDFIVLVSPSQAMRNVVKSMSTYTHKDSILVILSKGLENGSLKTMSDVVSEELPENKIVVMSGPSHAEEVSRDIPTANVAVSNDLEAAKKVQSEFMNEYFRIYTGTDVLGVELGGAIKNVIALCAGIVDGIGFGDNTKAALMTRGMREISRLGVKMGAKEETFNGLAGIGDLIVTCTSMHSRNRRAGILIGQGYSLEETIEKVHMVVEGVYSTKATYELAKKHNVDMPIVTEAYNVLYNGKNAKQALIDLMTREKKDETY